MLPPPRPARHTVPAWALAVAAAAVLAALLLVAGGPTPSRPRAPSVRPYSRRVYLIMRRPSRTGQAWRVVFQGSDPPPCRLVTARMAKELGLGLICTP